MRAVGGVDDGDSQFDIGRVGFGTVFGHGQCATFDVIAARHIEGASAWCEFAGVGGGVNGRFALTIIYLFTKLVIIRFIVEVVFINFFVIFIGEFIIIISIITGCKKQAQE